MCLHINGRFWKLFIRWMTTEKVPFDLYCMYDIEDGKDNDNPQRAIGFGDFTIFNDMILCIVDPVLPTTVNVFIALGCIACIQVGHSITVSLFIIWKQRPMSGLPCRVICVSVYNVTSSLGMYNKQ
ncbi:unnamed protein product [Adineta ricciae]|uniref:Uncharacterized protein n=1 Tax=Adineta ricciae TaxID=249248 RepID=A0A815V4N1_ADIRI|nr:unnamed protein product [Adineta ricciae]CAF1523114.1 unnamed protein product [Adineta ricciae]